MANLRYCQVVYGGVYDRHQGISMMRSVTLILGCCLVLILRKSKWNELTGHSRGRGKDRPNSRTNSLQPGEDDADQIQFGASLLRAIDPAIDRTIEHPPTFDRTHDNNRSQNSSPTSKATEEATDGSRLTA